MPSPRSFEWAEGVSEVPVRALSDGALAAVSAERQWGFQPDELRRIRAEFRALRREPTDVELAGLAQSWSEHCSYKSSKYWIQRGFAGLNRRPKVLGTGDAGVLRFRGSTAYALRIESHNHPSAIEPYGGAATGIGGILRDVLAVGGHPIALADPLFFGPMNLPRERTPSGIKSPRYLLDGVVAGIRDYGNRVGVPTVSGGVWFDPAYTVNPLVNVGCVGFLPRRRLRPNRAERAGNRLVLVGGLTGRDGIGGVAFASRELSERSEETSRGAVQLGDPIMKEPLIRGCLEAFDRGLVRGVKDLGGGGLATASGELAFAGGFGLRIDLDRVPLREPGLRPWEIWISESQERMVLDVRPSDVDTVRWIFERYDVPATDIGEVTRTGREDLYYHDRPASSLPLRFRIEHPLLRRRALHRKAPRGPDPSVPDDDIRGLFESLVLAPDSVSREPVIRVYEREVQGHTVVQPLHGRVVSPSHGDATVLQPDRGDRAGLAITVAAQPWACQMDPKRGAVWVVEEAARNLYAVGARPDAFTNCLNFGNPEEPDVLGDFVDVVDGLAGGARLLGFAVPSGNVSFYNGGLGASIPPTPVLMATGLVPDVARVVTSDLKDAGNPVYLLGRSSPALGGSLWARRTGAAAAPVPPTDPRAVRRVGEALLRAGRSGWVRAAHDVSDGGLALTLAEMAFGGGLGFDVDLRATGLSGPGIALAVEGASRWVVEVEKVRSRGFERALRGLPWIRLGEARDGPSRLRWGTRSIAEVDTPSLYDRWRGGFAAL